jgi:hypothetical protein
VSTPESDVGETADAPAGPVEPDRRAARPSPPVTHRIVPRVAAALLVLALVVLVVAVLRGDVVGWVGSVVHEYYGWLSGWFPLL